MVGGAVFFVDRWPFDSNDTTSIKLITFHELHRNALRYTITIDDSRQNERVIAIKIHTD